MKIEKNVVMQTEIDGQMVKWQVQNIEQDDDLAFVTIELYVPDEKFHAKIQFLVGWDATIDEIEGVFVEGFLDNHYVEIE